MGEGEPPSVSRGALSTSESSGPDSRPPNMTLWTPHCHILFENLSGFPAVGGGWGPFRSPHRSLGEGEHVSQLGAQTCLSSQSWARGGRPDGRTESPLSPSAFPSPLLPYLLPLASPFSFALSQLFSFLPLGGCHSPLMLPFLCLPFAPSLLPLLAQLWEDQLPAETYGGGLFGVQLIPLLASTGPLSPLLQRNTSNS